MNIQTLSDRATLPRPFMGYHLCSASGVTVPARGHVLIQTDLKIELPEGVLARLVLAPYKMDMLQLSVGEIQDREENLSFVLFQKGTQDYVVKAGEVLVQLILERSP
jgi:dUTPase